MYEKIKEMINDLFNDKSQSLEGTLEDLQGLRDEIEIMIEAIEADLEAQRGPENE